MSGRNSSMLKVARPVARERGPVRIGELMPEVLARYVVQEEIPAPGRRKVSPAAAVRLGQQTLALLAEVG